MENLKKKQPVDRRQFFEKESLGFPSYPQSAGPAL